MQIPITEELSIIVPVYDSARTLKYLFDSLKKQSILPKEIIFVDNGSKDNTLNLLKDFKITFNAAEVAILKEEKRGPSAARNKGIRYANTPLVGFIDSDVSINDDWVKNAVNFFKVDSTYDGVSGFLTGYPTDNVFHKFQTASRETFSFQETALAKDKDVFTQGFFSFNNAVCKKQVFEKAAFLREDYLVGEDLCFSIEAVRRGAKIYVAHTGMLAYHHERDSLKDYIKTLFRYRLALAKIIKTFFSGKALLMLNDHTLAIETHFFTVFIDNYKWLFAAPLLLFLIIMFPRLIYLSPFVLYLFSGWQVLSKKIFRNEPPGYIFHYAFFQSVQTITNAFCCAVAFFRYGVLFV